jgi:hypothetical protein
MNRSKILLRRPKERVIISALSVGHFSQILGLQLVTRHTAHVRDLHATLLHLLGIDHERLTFKYQGRYFRLTDIAGKVVQEVIA